MAGIDVGDAGKRRSTNSEINMIPFIDLLMVTIAFLLITAVWVTSSRVNASADVPGPNTCDGDCKQDTSPQLHVVMREHGFDVAWKQGATVISEVEVARPEAASGSPRYDDLARAVATSWKDHHAHADPSDRASDTAVLHSDDHASFREIVAVLDAINATQRDYRAPSGKATPGPAFRTTFAVR
ncbi:MAG TPA: biopolymer transporter ExbD [Byssovorax sp.]|jgi:biopolymer transport protein ExbD